MIYVWRERFAIARAKKPIDAFAVIKDENEITVILEKSKADHEDIIEANRGWRILTFDLDF